MHVCLHLWILHSFFTSLDLAPFVSQTPFPLFLPRTDTLLTPALGWYLPAAQSRHVETTDAPVVVEYLPAAQLVQTSLVCSGEPKNLPAAQSVQTAAPADEYLPATQLPQSVALVFASEPKNLPAAQSVQSEAPTADYKHISACSSARDCDDSVSGEVRRTCRVAIK